MLIEVSNKKVFHRHDVKINSKCLHFYLFLSAQLKRNITFASYSFIRHTEITFSDIKNNHWNVITRKKQKPKYTRIFDMKSYKGIFTGTMLLHGDCTQHFFLWLHARCRVSEQTQNWFFRNMHLVYKAKFACQKLFIAQKEFQHNDKITKNQTAEHYMKIQFS